MKKRRHGRVMQRVGVSGSSWTGDPADAIELIRDRLGESFRKGAPNWSRDLAGAIEALKGSVVRFEGDSDELHDKRLRRKVLTQKPRFVVAIEQEVRLCVLILGHPANKLVKDDILPKLDYWHHRTGRRVDFVCLGFSDHDQDVPDGRGFCQIVRMFQEELDWSYSGETDMLIFNITYNAQYETAIMHLSTVVALTLERAIEQKAINSVSALMEDIIVATENHTGNDPAWAFSDNQGMRIAGSTLKRFFLSLLPEWARDDASRGFHFYVKDLERRRRNRQL